MKNFGVKCDNNKKTSRKVLPFLSPAVAHRVFEDDCDIRVGDEA